MVSKCALGINEQLQKRSVADVLSLREKIQKTQREGGGWQPYLLVHPRVKKLDGLVARQSGLLSH